MTICFSACTLTNFAPENSHVNNQIEETMESATFTVSPPEELSYLHPIQDITPGYIHDIEWSLDSQTIFFNINNEEWAYDLSIGKSQRISLEQAYSGGTSVQLLTPEATPSVPINVSGNLELASVSPSGRKAVIFGLNTSPTLTPLPTDGEAQASPYSVKVWIWETGSLSHFPSIKICGANEFFWPENEGFVVVQTSCLFSEIWVIDLEQKKMLPILPLDEYGGFVDFHSFSPNQGKLLISYEGVDNNERLITPYIFDVKTWTAVKLDAPPFTRPIEWLNNDELIVLYSHYFGIDGTDRLGIFNLQTGELDALLDDESDVIFTKLDVQWGSLSPDKQYIAFTIEQEPYRSSDLWLLYLNR